MKETKWLNLSEATAIIAKEIGIKDQQTIVKFINAKKLRAVIWGGKNQGKRYKIKNEWITEFIANFESGSF